MRSCSGESYFEQANKVKMIPLVSGIADDNYIEIRSGIRPGDEVLSGSYTAINPKRRLHLDTSVSGESAVYDPRFHWTAQRVANHDGAGALQVFSCQYTLCTPPSWIVQNYGSHHPWKQPS